MKKMFLQAVLILAIAVAAQGNPSAVSDVERSAEMQPQTRAIFASREPLASRLLPDDRIVIVQKIETPNVAGPTSPESPTRQLSRLAAQADAILVGDVVSVLSSLTSDGTWITTHVSLTPSNRIKDRAIPSVVVRGSATLEYDGGEVSIKGVSVRAGSYPLIEKGGRYLVFSVLNPETGSWHVAGTFQIKKNGILDATPMSDRRPNSLVTGMSLETALRHLGRP